MGNIKNLRTNIILNAQNKKEYQLILASQQLGTFFCVYANFEKKEENKYAVDFYLKNYKGAVNLDLKCVKIKNYDNLVSIIDIVVGVQSSDKPTTIKSLELCQGEKTVNTKKDSWVVCELGVEIGAGIHQVFNTETHFRNTNEPNKPEQNTWYNNERAIAKNHYISFLREQLGKLPTGMKEQDNTGMKKQDNNSINKSAGDFCVIGISKVS